jgi:hypothetical protein
MGIPSLGRVAPRLFAVGIPIFARKSLHHKDLVVQLIRAR